MLARLTSLRLWLLAAMTASAIVGLAGEAILFRQIQSSGEHAADTRKALQEARTIARGVQAGRLARLPSFQSLLVNDQITVVRNGKTIFRGPALRRRELEFRVRAPFRNGFVEIADYSSPPTNDSLELTLITAGVLALVVAAAIVAASVVTRAVRAPVQRAIGAAERVSHGEFSARMGNSGPEELVKLGRAFDDMAARLERADRDQRQFLADVAHEIATPVNAVSGFALALADDAVQEPAQRADVKVLIEAGSRRLRDLITDLRELTRLDLAEGVHPTTVSTTAFAQELVSRFRPAAAAAGIELKLSAEAGEAFTDPRLLDMVASNLISNAIRYTPTGGHVEVRCRRQRDKLVLSVVDDGVGIAPEHQTRIFERLYRVDSTRDRATGGSGLGLAIASRAAQSLGGHIELQSALGKGSEFRLIVPARLKPAVPQMSESAAR